MQKYKFLFAVTLLVFVGGFLFFYRLYRHDIQALTNFIVAYERFDRAIATYDASFVGEGASEARDALTALRGASVFRLSSLIKNEKELMSQALDIAAASEKEFDSLGAYKKAISDDGTNVREFAKTYNDFMNKRKTAYATFRRFAE